MGAERLPHVQRMILAETPADSEEPLSHIQKMQEDDFYGILKAMHGFPVTIRLLDPPLHEFLPNYESVLVEVVELPRDAHPWFLACQAHPEFLSTPRDGHPLFSSFIRAALRQRKGTA